MDPRYADCTLLHVDADGFFAAVEQSLDPSLRGRPVVTGAERGIIAAASYEAKALGVKRGVQLHEARALCPALAVLPSDYETYGMLSQRIFAILRRFTPHVEEYSVDEAFADLSGCGLLWNCPLDDLAARLRDTVRRELGLTVSVGISLTKTLAKICSKHRKPDGQTILPREHVPAMLARTPVGKVWGIGPASAAKLEARGIRTAEDLARMEGRDVLRLLHKPGHATWMELRGERVLPMELEARQDPASMMKGHTFAPPSADAAFVFAEAVRNLSAVLAKLRRHARLACELGLCLRHRDYAAHAATASLPLPTAHDAEVIPALRALFESLFQPGQSYRSTTVWLGGLVAARHRQADLFEDAPRRNALDRLDAERDHLTRLYGQGVLAPAATLALRDKPWHPRDAPPTRFGTPLRGEERLRLAIPRMTLPNPV